MQNFFCLGIVSVLWVVLAYSLAFGGTGSYIGNFEFFGLKDVTTAFPNGLRRADDPADAVHGVPDDVRRSSRRR